MEKQPKRIFVSSTYLDLEETREKVRDQLVGLSLLPVGMENFPATAQSTLDNSIEQLEGCNYYLLILGSRYGTISKGSSISTTHAEYRKAIELNKNNAIEDLFICIGDDNLLIEQGFRESDELQNKKKEFILEIKNDKNSFREFSNDEQLSTAISETIFKKYNPDVSDEIQIFENFENLKPLIESDLEGKSSRVNKALNQIVNEFSPLFNLKDEESPDLKHPMVSRTKIILEEAIPYLIFDTDFEGRVESWGIRHVIFRVETVIKLMLAIKDRKLLSKIGQEVGKTACIDLFEKVITKSSGEKLIPASLEVFIKLFDHWDSSAGWGQLRFEEEQIGNGDNTGKWIFFTKNSFLADTAGGQSKKEIEHLYSFWEGYIQGVLNEAISRLSEIYSGLSAEYTQKVEFPAYTKIINVVREPKESIKDTDIFYVYFEKHPYRWAFDILSNVKVKSEINEDKEDNAIVILTQLSSIISKLKHENEKRYNSIILNLSKNNQKTISYIESQRDDKIMSEINQCIGLVSLIVQQFINS